MKELKFIHITKTGGTSIVKCGLDNNILWGKYHKEYDIIHHKPFKYIDNHIKHKYDWFVIIRNPYTRIISEFHCPYFGYNGVFIKKNIIYDKNSFNEWIKYRIINRNNIPGYHFIEQSLYIDETININIIKYENLQNNFNELMKKYNLNINLNRHENNTEKKFNINDFNEDTINLINNIYYNDFINFNYSFIVNN